MRTQLDSLPKEAHHSAVQTDKIDTSGVGKEGSTSISLANNPIAPTGSALQISVFSLLMEPLQGKMLLNSL